MDQTKKSQKFSVGAVAGVVLTVAVVGVAWAGFNKKVEATRPAPAPYMDAAAATNGQLPPGHPPMGGGMGMGGMGMGAGQMPAGHPGMGGAPMGQEGGPTVKGKVSEVLQVSGYTYLKLEDDLGEMWAAVPTTEIKAGTEVSIAGAMTMENFHSRSLERTFPKIYFGTLAK